MPHQSTTSYSAALGQRIGELAKPLKEELRGIAVRLAEIEDEKTQLRADQRRIEQVLKTIDPTSFVATPKKAKMNGAPEAMEAKKQAVIDYLNKNRAYYTEHGIVAAIVYREMKADGIEPLTSPSNIKKWVEELHANGVLRAVAKIRGGAMLYRFVGEGGGDGAQATGA